MTIDELLATLDLDAKTRLLAGQDVWTLPALDEIGLASLVMSDGPVGVRGTRWSADDPSLVLPSPTALAATWDPSLAARAGLALAREARRKGVHVLLAPTVNLHRSPLGGRHFECYSEDPLLTGAIGAGYVSGVQEGGVATTVKHFVANDAETERFTVDVRADERTLRELYLAPFEQIVKTAAPWGIMAAYNQVNGSTMTEHDELVNGILRGEWGFDGFVVSDWLAARDTVRAANGGLDVAMPGPETVFGPNLAEAVRAGAVSEEVVDAMVRRVLVLASRTGALGDSTPDKSEVDGVAIGRELASKSFVLLRNENGLLPLGKPRSVAVIGAAAAEARILGGGSATVFPSEVTSPLDGLRDAFDHVRYELGADPRTTLRPAKDGFTLTGRAVGEDGAELVSFGLTEGSVQWIGALPYGLDPGELGTVEISGTYVPDESGTHEFGITGLGHLTLTVGGETLFDGPNLPSDGSFMDAVMRVSELRVETELTAGEPVDVRLSYSLPDAARGGNFTWISFSLRHSSPAVDADELIARAVAAAAGAEVAVVVVATTDEVESEGFDRTSLALPGRQDELVARVAEANPRTIVVVNSGSPVEMPWASEVDAVLLTWFPGQSGGAALADVLSGAAEPGGRLPTTWPARTADAPVLDVTPVDGVLRYEEGVFIGYRAWERAGATPAYWFGHGLGYTDWTYESVAVAPADGDLARVRVRLRNSGSRAGREVVQAYLSTEDTDELPRPKRWLAGFAVVEASPGESVEVDIAIPERAASVWDSGWRLVTGEYQVEIGQSYADTRLAVALVV
ncbi:beta-glucosidase family protein [Amycolatopsis sp. CA-230715]|uniref:beta-glucosidase family protein n=1 Tax=Amycolatopsis sp. CA-230715 TaxID=2745196 RepID=UPI001C02DD60|nr:glycoside hydrolase family 3 C-terminal domain-containing protein [Amycolatopsis sp. CA-230715]QWF83352.1 Beta-hexosaminidase [Amycolatopsis sp. CA-230715]